MTSTDCLTSIDYNSGENIYVITDASLTETRAVLDVGKFWEKAWLVAFNSSKYILAECKYSVHEQGMLMIIQALKKWCFYFLRARFSVYFFFYQQFITQRMVADCSSYFVTTYKRNRLTGGLKLKIKRKRKND